MTEQERRHVNGHTLVLPESEWLCLQCRHYFDALVDAELFWCGDACVHPGGDR